MMAKTYLKRLAKAEAPREARRPAVLLMEPFLSVSIFRLLCSTQKGKKGYQDQFVVILDSRNWLYKGNIAYIGIHSKTD